MRRSLLTFAFVILASCALLCQTNTGSITGEVRDTDKAVVPGVSVTITNQGTGQSAHAISSDAGVFTVSGLEPGTYRVMFRRDGFAESTILVDVHTASTTSVDAVLSVGAAKGETLLIEAGAATVNSESSTITSTIGEKALDDMPMAERSTLSIVMLAPGVQGDPQYQGGVQSENPGIYTQPVTPGGSLQMGGGRPGSGSILVDGSDISLSAYPRTGVTFSSLTISEVAVQQNGVPAQYGRTGGGIINQTTRGGTNQWHGGANWQHTEPNLQAYAWGSPYAPMKHMNMFAGAFGGPVDIPHVYDGHNKTFFFVTVEPLRMDDQTWMRAQLPTAEELQGDFSNSLSLLNQTILRNQGYAAAVAAPRSGHLYYQWALDANGFPTAGRLSSSNYTQVLNDNLSAQLAKNPVAQWIFSNVMPSPNRPSPYYHYYTGARTDGTNFANDGTNAYAARGVSNTDNRYSIRIDHAITPSNQLKGRYTVVPVQGVRYNGLGLDSPGNEVPTDSINSQNATISFTHFFQSGAVNEFRTTFMRGNRERGPAPAALSQNWGATMSQGLASNGGGLYQAAAGVGFPQLSGITTGWGIGSGGTQSDMGRSIDQNFGLADDFSLVRGAHTIKYGVDTRMMQLNRLDTSYLTGGKYSFSAGTTNYNSIGGNPLASFVLGEINGFQAKTVATPFYYRWKYYAGYVQDDWKVRSNITLNIGLRYNLEMPRKEKYDRQGSFDPNIPVTINGISTTGAFTFCGQNGRAETLWPANYFGFEPRFGVAWALTSRMTVRSSYALVHVPLTGLGNNVLPDLSLPPNSVTATTGGINPANPTNYVNNPIAPMQASPVVSQGPLVTWNTTQMPYVSQSNALPFVQLWSFSAQFQVNKKTVIEAGYAGQKARHLFSVPVDKNAPTLGALEALASKNVNFSSSNIINPLSQVSADQIQYVFPNENLVQALRPYQQFYNNAIVSAYDRNGTSSYNSLYVTGRSQIGNLLTVQSSFTWSKSLDNASSGSTDFNATDSFGFAHPQLPYIDYAGMERSYSTFDIPMRLTTGYKLDVPLGKKHALKLQNGILNSVLGDWANSGMLTIQSGTPIPLVFSSSSTNQGWFCSTAPATSSAPNPTTCGQGYYLEDAYIRPNIAPGVSLINSNWKQDPLGMNGGGYLNPAALTVPGSLGDPQVGNAPRTLGNARNPRIVSFDASLIKQIPTKSEHFRLELRADAINVFNHPNFLLSRNGGQVFGSLNAATSTTPAYYSNSLNFGVMQQAGSSRMIKLGLKASF